MLVAGLPLAAAIIGQLAQATLPVLFLNRAVTDARLGEFSAAWSLVRYFPALQSVAVAAMVPSLVQSAAPAALLGRFRLTATALGALAAGGLFLAAGKAIPALYGASFAPAAAVLRELAPLALLCGLEAAWIARLLAARRQRAIGAAALASALVLVAALAILTPLYGVAGACRAVIIGQAAGTVMLGIAAARPQPTSP